MAGVKVAVIADDLTGALDVCAPLAARGLACHIATHPGGTEAALAQSGDVVCVNSASREMPEAEAAGIVARIAARLAQERPQIVFKKVDSRLKGHVAAETEACLAAFGRQCLVIAPAIPDQGRRVADGVLRGIGITDPIAIADRFTPDLPATIPDCRTLADLERAARADWQTTLLVGASGLGEGLARQLVPGDGQRALPAPALPLLLAIGSHDPITLAQAAAAVAALPGLRHVVSADGTFPPGAPLGDIVLFQAGARPGHPGHAQIMARFGHNTARLLREGPFASALISGGETAQTILRALDIACVRLIGAAAPGIALVRAEIGGRRVDILTKSGGFGTPDELVRLCRSVEKTRRNNGPNIGEEKA